MSLELIDVLVPVPLLDKFTYKVPKRYQNRKFKRGVRLRIPFRNRMVIGIFWEYSDPSKNKRSSYKFIKEVLDENSLLDKTLLGLADWASRYYHYPLGEVITYFFPPSLRKGKEARFKELTYWKVTDKGDFFDLSKLKKASRQKEGLELLRERGDLSEQFLKVNGISKFTINNLYKKELIQKIKIEQLPLNSNLIESFEEKELTSEQSNCVKAITREYGNNKTLLLNWVTGS